MKLYPKKLSSVEELKREQLRLKVEKLHTKTSDLMPIKELGRSKKSSNLFSLALDVANSRSSLQTAMLLAGPALRLFSGKKKSREYKEGPRKKSFLKAALTDIIVGYLIGKAVQMGIHGIRIYVRARKSRKQREREEEYERNMGW